MILAKGTSGITAVPLAKAPGKGTYRIDRVTGPLQCRLSEMGMVEGREITVINQALPNMMVVKLGDSRLALAREMVDQIWVK